MQFDLSFGCAVNCNKEMELAFFCLHFDNIDVEAADRYYLNFLRVLPLQAGTALLHPIAPLTISM
jgi:hypothetical protein